MERNNSKKWINSLKISIINNELKKIEEYSNRDIPKFSSIDEAKEALNLIEQAKNILEKEKNKLKIQMNKIKQTQKYIITMNNNTTNNWKA